MANETETNQFPYKLSQESPVKELFIVLQSKSGCINLLMGTCWTRLTKQQISDLGIDVYSLEEFNYDEFHKAYDNYTVPVAISAEDARLKESEPALIKVCKSTLEYLDILYPDKTCCHPKFLMD